MRKRKSPKAETSPTDATAKGDIEEISEPDVVKSDESGFPGEMEINLGRVMSSGQTLGEQLSTDLSNWLDRELENHSHVVDKLALWDKLYRGKKKPKSYPYPACSNTAIPITRILTDAVTVRIMDVIWGQKKVFLCTPVKDEFREFAAKIEEGIEWWQKNIAKLKRKLFSPIMQAIKTGTGFVLGDYVRKNKLVYRYASAEEIARKDPGLFKFSNGQWGIKKSNAVYDGPDLFPISREDFIYSSDAVNLQEALFCGYRFYLRKPEVKARVGRGHYLEEGWEKLGAPDQLDETKIKRAESKGIEIKPHELDKYEFWRLWVRYDVDEDGEEDDVVVVFNRERKAIMRAVYNPLFAGFRPIVPLVFNPVEFSMEGEGTCEILETIATEIDYLHNGRLDRVDQINAPMILVREGSSLENMTGLTPGLVRVTNDDLDGALRLITFPDVFPSTVNEEHMDVNYAQQAIGASPQLLGQSTSERPVARETFQVIQEANKKFKFGVDNFRDCFADIGMMVIEFFAQYKPRYTYFEENAETGVLQEQTVDFPFEFLREGLNVELAASSELMNTETRRETNLALYQLLSDYYSKLAGMVQLLENPQVPTDFKIFLLAQARIGGDLLKAIVEDFGKKNPENLILDLEKTIDVQKALAMQPSPPPPPGQGGSPNSGSGPPHQGPGRPGGGLPPPQRPTPQGPPQTPTGQIMMPPMGRRG